jgi:hypothetical protein
MGWKQCSVYRIGGKDKGWELCVISYALADSLICVCVTTVEHGSGHGNIGGCKGGPGGGRRCGLGRGGKGRGGQECGGGKEAVICCFRRVA